MSNSLRAYALIPARSGSKGIPDKNIREIAGHPLLAYSIAFAKKINFERILVSTDSPRYQAVALRYGAECPYLRGAEASSDKAMEEDVLADLASNLPGLGIEMPDIWVRLKPTSPLRSVRSVEAAIAALEADPGLGIEMPDIWVRLKPTSPLRSVRSVEAAIAALEADPGLDSVRIVSEAEARLHVVNKDGYLEPLSPQWDPGRSVMRRDEFPRAYKPFNLDVLRHALWIERGSAYMGRRIKPIVEHRITGLDIDDEDDLELAGALISIKPRPQFLKPYIHDPA